MADELDPVLRDAMQRAAQPGDPTGVAEAVRTRVAAGDPGTPAGGSTAPGWGGGPLGWLPWLGLVVLAGGVGVALGVSGMFGAPESRIESGYTIVLDDAVPALACPGGPAAGRLSAGDRVLAIARSEDSGYLGVRDPDHLARTLWVERSLVVVDAGQPEVALLPVESCPVAQVEVVPAPEPTPTEEPTEEPDPVPVPGDTVSPVIAEVEVVPLTTLYQDDQTSINAYTTDDVGVVSVVVTWSGAASGSANMIQQSGALWSFPFSRGTGPNGQVTFVIQAYDAAGNLSSPVEAEITLDTLD